MHLDDVVESVAAQLQAAAALGDERTQQIAAALAATVDSAVRLAVIQAGSALAAETSLALLEAGGSDAPSVTTHVDGDELSVRVTGPVAQAADAPADDGDASARISLRLSEALKTQIEQAAGAEGISVNSWLVRAATHALAGRRGPWAGYDATARGSHRVTGWVTG
jgi:hypothetical protein